MLDKHVAKLLAEIDGALSFVQAIRDESPLVYETTEMRKADAAIAQLRLIRSLFPECDVPEEVNIEHAFSAAWTLWTIFDVLADDANDRVIESISTSLFSIAQGYGNILSEETFKAVKGHLEDTRESLDEKPNLKAYVTYWESRLGNVEEKQ